MAFIKNTQHFLQLSKQFSVSLRLLTTCSYKLMNIYNIQTVCWPSKKAKYVINFFNGLRAFTTSSKISDNYEGDGKTTVTILNRECQHLIMIDSYSSLGFRLNNGIFAVGPLAAFPKTILQWNVNCVEELTPESFSLFCLLDPKIDILVIGTGDYRQMPEAAILKFLKTFRISAEILPTDKAVSLFNFLNAEGRCVAGAFLPPMSLVVYEEEMKLLDEVEAIDDYRLKPSTHKIQK